VYLKHTVYHYQLPLAPPPLDLPPPPEKLLLDDALDENEERPELTPPEE